MSDPRAVHEAYVVEEGDPRGPARLESDRSLRGVEPSCFEESLAYLWQFSLEERWIGGLLGRVKPELSDGPADHLEQSPRRREAKPQVVIHAVVRVLVDASSGTAPKVSGEKDFGLKEKLTRVPGSIEVEKIVEREGSVFATGEMSISHLPVAPQFADAGYHVGAAGMKSHSHSR
jgi:hypothetical protein